jgi:ATP-binding cassette subfamily B protein
MNMKLLTFTLELFKKFPGLFTLNVFLMISAGLLEMVSVFAIAPIIDVFLHPNLSEVSSATRIFMNLMEVFDISTTKINFMIILLVCVVLQSIFVVLARYAIIQTKYAVLKDLFADVFSSFFNASWHFFSRGNKGTLLNTFSREMGVTGDAFGKIGGLISDIFRLLFYLAVPFYISWKVTFIAIGLSLFCSIPLLFLGRINYRLGQKNTSTANKMTEVIQESFGLAKVILGYGNQRQSMVELDKAFDQHREVTVKKQALDKVTSKIFEPFGWAAILLTIYVSLEGLTVPIADVAIIVYALLRCVPLIGIISAQNNALVGFFPSYEQVINLKEQAKQDEQKTGVSPFSQLKKSIEFKGVDFSYQNRSPVLEDINAIIEQGKTVAFVGESGAGKSTLIDLLIGFYEPCDGTITVDGIPLLEYDIISFRKKIGFVPQDSILFNDTIRNNLLWSYEKATEEEVVAACKLANAHDFVMEMPKDYDTVVGDRGVRLSGGQRQRIALARALLRKPELLILDEATSSLDSQSETLIQEAIEKIANQTTIVIIAHRLSTIANADWIYVLEEGRVVEQGTYGELIDLKSSLKRMAELQGLVK